MSTRGNIDYNQIRDAARQGTGTKIQMNGGGVITTGHIAVYDAAGNVIDGGPVPSGGGGGAGTVTLVGVTMPNEFVVTGSPVTTTGTIAVTKATQNVNTVYAGPSSGGAAVPTFRALTAADLSAVAVGLQTPWLSDINANNFNLNNAGLITSNEGIVVKNNQAVGFLEPTNVFTTHQYILGPGGNCNFQYRPNTGTAFANAYTCDPTGNISFGVGNFSVGGPVVLSSTLSVTGLATASVATPANGYLRVVASPLYGDTNDGRITVGLGAPGLNVVGINSDNTMRKVSFWGQLAQVDTPSAANTLKATTFSGVVITAGLTNGSGNIDQNAGGNIRALAGTALYAYRSDNAAYGYMNCDANGNLSFVSSGGAQNFQALNAGGSNFSGRMTNTGNSSDLVMYNTGQTKYLQILPPDGAGGAHPTFASSTGTIVFNPVITFASGTNINFGSNWVAWTPSINAGTMTLTSVVYNRNWYLRIGPIIFFELSISATYGGTVTGQILFSLPVAVAGAEFAPCYCNGTVGSGASYAVALGYVSGSNIQVNLAANANFTAGTNILRISGHYRCV